MEKNAVEINKSLLKYSDDVVIYLSFENKVMALSEVARLTLSLPNQDLLNKDLFEYCAKQNIRLPFNESTLRTASDSKQAFINGEIAYADGRKYIANWKYIYCREDKSTGYFLIIGKDISDLIMQKNNANTSKIYLKKIVESLPEYIYWKDENLVYQGCNKHVAEYLGLKSPDEVVGKTDRDFGWDESRIKTLHDIDREIIEQDKKVIVEDVIPKADGSQRIMLTNKVPLHDERGIAIGLLGISYDVTEIKQAELELAQAKTKAEYANKAKSEFLSVMNHALRGPLNHIKGMLYILSNMNLPMEARECIEIADNSASSIIPLLNTAQDYLNIEFGKIEPYPEECDLRSIIEDIVKNVSSLNKNREIDYVIDMQGDLPERLFIDSYRLCQILDTLLTNAARFTKKGLIVVRVCINDCQLGIVVEDTGEGISEEKIKYLFGFFASAQDISGRRYADAGLRLSITKKLVDILGGTVNVDSKVNQYTRFTIMLPFKEALSNNKDEVTNWDKFRSQAKILIIDDKKRRGEALIDYIGQFSNKLTNSNEAISAIEEAEKIYKRSYDVIIIYTDIHIKKTTDFIHSIQHKINMQETAILLVAHSEETEALKRELHFNNLFFFNSPIYPRELQNFLTKTWDSRFKIITKALLIEDDLISQKIEATILKDLGCQVDVATTGKEAIKLIHQGYDVIFVDIGLSDIDGIELARTITQALPPEKLPPIIAVTALVSEADRERFIGSGIMDIVPKPVSKEAFRRVLNGFDLR